MRVVLQHAIGEKRRLILKIQRSAYQADTRKLLGICDRQTAQDRLTAMGRKRLIAEKSKWEQTAAAVSRVMRFV
jgi:hypothetical protein